MRLTRACSVVVAVGVLAAGMGVATAGPAAAATVTVTNCADAGTGSLRQAVDVADSGDTIDFATPLGCSAITLGTGVILIDKDLTITGPGASELAVDGNASSNVLQIAVSRTVSISGLAIRNGRSSTVGAGIRNAGSLTLSASTVTGNTYTGADFDGGGGIYNSGTLTMSATTVTGNAGRVGGGIYNAALASMTVTASVVADNSATVTAGGIYNIGSMTVTASTVADNTTTSPNPFSSSGITSSGQTFVVLSTVAGNTLVNGAGLVVTGSIISGVNACLGVTDAGYNLDTGSSCVNPLAPATGSVANTPAGLDLSGLADNGGPTQTIALAAGSAAIGMIPNGANSIATPFASATGLCPRTDQRGIASPGGGACDAGAFQTVTVACAAGFFSATGNAPCTAAPPGYFVATSEALAATACAVGTYQDQAGQASCVPAPIGFYVSQTAAIVATACPQGTTTLVQGATSVGFCVAELAPPPPGTTIGSGQVGVPLDAEALFTSPLALSPSDFDATIDWGDGTTSAGAVSAGPGGSGLLVSGTHTYLTAGNAAVTVAVQQKAPGDIEATAHMVAIVSPGAAHRFIGFSAPVDNDGVVNLVKAGQTVPLKWRLTTTTGVPVTNLADADVAVTVSGLSCSTGPSIDALEEYSTGGSGLQNLGDGYYQWNWKTPRSYAGSCKTMTLSIGGSSNLSQDALFRFIR